MGNENIKAGHFCPHFLPAYFLPSEYYSKFLPPLTQVTVQILNPPMLFRLQW